MIMEAKTLDKVAVFKGWHVVGLDVKVIKPGPNNQTYVYTDGKVRFSNVKMLPQEYIDENDEKAFTVPPIYDKSPIYRFAKNYTIDGLKHCLFMISRDKDTDRAEAMLDHAADKGIDPSYLNTKQKWAYVD